MPERIYSIQELRGIISAEIPKVCPPEQYGFREFITHQKTRYFRVEDSTYLVGEWGHGYDCSAGSRRVAHLLRKSGFDPQYVSLDESETQELFFTDIALQVSLQNDQTALIRTVPFFPIIDTYTKPKNNPFRLSNEWEEETVAIELKQDTSMILGWNDQGQDYMMSGAGISSQSLERYLANTYPGSEHFLNSRKNGPLMIYGTTRFPKKIQKRTDGVVKADTLIPTFIDSEGNVTLGQSASILVQNGKNKKLVSIEEAPWYFPLWEDDKDAVLHLAHQVVDAQRRDFNVQDFELWLRYFAQI